MDVKNVKMHRQKFLTTRSITSISSCDYYLFLHLKKWLVSQWFDNDDKLKNGINKWLKTLAQFFENGIRKLM